MDRKSAEADSSTSPFSNGLSSNLSRELQLPADALFASGSTSARV
jgi:hypothetical protein